MNKRAIANLLIKQNKLVKRFIVISNDFLIVLFSFLISSSIFSGVFSLESNIFHVLLIIFITGIIFYYRNIHDNVIKNIGIQYIYNLSFVIFVSFFSYYISIRFLMEDILFANIVFVSGFISFFLILFSRITAKYILYDNVSTKEKIILYTDYKDVSGAVNLAANSTNFELVGIIHSEKKNEGRLIDNIKIFGIGSFSKLVKEKGVYKLFIASDNNIKDLDKSLFEQIISLPIKVFKIPDLEDIISKKDSFNDLKNLSLEDFISRKVDDEIKLTDKENKIIKDKVVLITGAGGSIGSVLSKQIIVNGPKKLIILDNSEFNLFKIQSDLKSINSDIEVVSKLVDISNKNLLHSVFNQFTIDTVYHAAAYKHVNILEDEVQPAINNNIIGTYSLLNECHSSNVKNFVMISTDKAANPSTIMGKTKKFCELMVQYFDNKNESSSYVSVRFGNVFNSSGSVIQIFKNQIKQGKDLTVTDPNVDRFFMSIEEAVKLVIKASIIGRGGEVFVLDMGTPIKILDIAKRMIHLSGNTIRSDSNPDGDIGIIITGLKKGEKLHEILSEKSLEKTENPQIFLSKDTNRVDNIEELIISICDSINRNDKSLMSNILEIAVGNSQKN